MKSFTITADQITRVIGAAVADELARRFNRHIDFLTIASWSEKTAISDGGMALTHEERAACAQRLCELFGMDPDALSDKAFQSIRDWAGAIEKAIAARLTHFAFRPAARDADLAASTHRADELYQDAAAAANLLYGRRRLLSLVAPHSLIGFALTVLTPNLQGVASVDARGMTPEELSASLAFGDVLVATPTLWRYMTRENLKAPDNSMAVSFGEPMTPDLMTQMRKAGFGVLRELYGSTETGLIGWRNSPGEAFVLFEHWRRSTDALVRIAPDGAEREVTPMDLIEWTGERNFKLQGRRDGAVQVGAVNVFPDEIAASIESHDRIARCEIRVGSAADGVNRLIANIQLADNVMPTEAIAREIDMWCRKNLRQQERPRIYHYLRAT